MSQFVVNMVWIDVTQRNSFNFHNLVFMLNQILQITHASEIAHWVTRPLNKLMGLVDWYLWDWDEPGTGDKIRENGVGPVSVVQEAGQGGPLRGKVRTDYAHWLLRIGSAHTQYARQGLQPLGKGHCGGSFPGCRLRDVSFLTSLTS